MIEVLILFILNIYIICLIFGGLYYCFYFELLGSLVILKSFDDFFKYFIVLCFYVELMRGNVKKRDNRNV